MMVRWLRFLLVFLISGLIAILVIQWQQKRAQRAADTQMAMAAMAELSKEPEDRITYPDGSQVELSLPNGKREVVRSILNINKPMRFGAYVWDEKGVPDGPVWVRVDLAKQILSVFRGGHEIGSAVILFGTDGKLTPIGEFAIRQKAADYHSRTYDAPMPYMLRLTDDGVALHGSDVRMGRATHGCIGLPIEFARLLFEQMKLGDTVVILPDAPAKA